MMYKNNLFSYSSIRSIDGPLELIKIEQVLFWCTVAAILYGMTFLDAFAGESKSETCSIQTIAALWLN